MGLRGFLDILQKMKHQCRGSNHFFFGLPALSLSNILSALSGLAVNYRIGNLGDNAAKASGINIRPLCNARKVFYINVFDCLCRTLKRSI